MTDLAPLSVTSLATTWQWSLGVTVALIVALAVFAALMARYRRTTGKSWPALRTISGFLAALLIAECSEGGLGVYGQSLFYLHMVEHLLLIMIVPLLIIAAGPLQLLADGSADGGVRVRAFMRSPVVSVLTHPAVTLVAYTLLVAGTHLTGFMNAEMSSPALHTAEITAYVVVGYLYFCPLVGREPVRWNPSPIIRMVLLAVAMPVDTFTGVVLGQTTHYPWPAMAAMQPSWGPGALADLHGGGAVMWIGGDAIMAALFFAAFYSWSRRSDERADLGSWLESGRAQALADRTGVATAGSQTVDTDADLDAYNEYLRRLAGDGRP